MILETDLSRIAGAACLRLDARFAPEAQNALVGAVRKACQVAGQELELEMVLAGIYGHESRERALTREGDIASSTERSIRKTETDAWADHPYLIKALRSLVLETDAMPELVRCNLTTAFALIGYAIRTSRRLTVAA